MSGADLSNLVNEAALFAVRRGAHEVHQEDFDAARDRVLMGLRRESLALSEEEKEIVAYHEGGHAVCAYVLEYADPLHKVTILPTGMALGVTQQLPVEERHIYKREYIVDSLVVRLGGRVAEELDLRPPVDRRRERPRRQHRARPQDGARVGHVRPRRPDGVGLAGRGVPRRGPHALPRLLRRDRTRHRRRGRAHPPRRGGPLPQGARPSTAPGLDAVAKALLERETLEGEEVATLVDDGDGPQGRRAAHDHCTPTAPRSRRAEPARTAIGERLDDHRRDRRVRRPRRLRRVARRAARRRRSTDRSRRTRRRNDGADHAVARRRRRVIGAAVDVVALVQRAVCGVLDLGDRDVVATRAARLVVAGPRTSRSRST